MWPPCGIIRPDGLDRSVYDLHSCSASRRIGLEQVERRSCHGVVILDRGRNRCDCSGSSQAVAFQENDAEQSSKEEV